MLLDAVAVRASPQCSNNGTSLSHSARRLDSESIDRLLGRCGRVADTPDPARYAALFKVASAMFRSRLKYGFMVPINLVIHGSVHHPLYREKRTPQMAPLMLFKLQERQWITRCVLWVGDQRMMCSESEITSLYRDFDVEVITVSAEAIDSGDLDTSEFKTLLNRAIYSPCAGSRVIARASTESLPVVVT